MKNVSCVDFADEHDSRDPSGSLDLLVRLKLLCVHSSIFDSVSAGLSFPSMSCSTNLPDAPSSSFSLIADKLQQSLHSCLMATQLPTTHCFLLKDPLLASCVSFLSPICSLSFLLFHNMHI